MMGSFCSNNIPLHVLEQTNRHPCYSVEVHQQFARMHLPVAPNCNVQCNYCNRKFDCVNESRPGVTSEVLTPAQAVKKYYWVKEKIQELTVIGIAGPGDALADWQYTKQTIEEIKAIDKDMIFCLSTNGLLLPRYASEIVDLGIHHVTVTVNALDPEIGAKIYRFAMYEGKRYEGVEAARLLCWNQLAGIEYLTTHGVLVKVNIVMIKGVNDHHIPDVVKKVKDLGVFITNIMPLIPAAGSSFEHYPQTSMKELNAMRNRCQLDIQQMRHCQQCRADAIGKLGEDRSREFQMCHRHAEVPVSPVATTKQYRIAVTSKYGKLVDQHFGHAEEFTIYEGNPREFKLVEKRPVAKYCLGMEECGEEEARQNSTLRALEDCQAVLTMRIGRAAKDNLAEKGIRSIEYCDTVESGLRYAVTALEEEATLIRNGKKTG
jgi:nitrogen fixation protein NifB